MPITRATFRNTDELDIIVTKVMDLMDLVMDLKASRLRCSETPWAPRKARRMVCRVCADPFEGSADGENRHDLFTWCDDCEHHLDHVVETKSD
jgi:hypothetical protein